MYPQLMNQAARMAPMLQRLFQRGVGGFTSLLGRASQIDVPNVDATPITPRPPISGLPEGPISDPHKPNYPVPGDKPAAPNVPALGGLGLFPAEPSTPMNWLEMAKYRPTPAPTAPAPAVAAPAPQASPVPMPMARPAEAPAPQPDTGFFMRNALMMQDPNGGGFIDPAGAASVRGPDLIAKMMGYLHNKVS
jgi:hypothetical protein